MDCTQTELTEFQDRLDRIQKLLVISGAGCSTGSGIGDYRDNLGNWKRVQPVQHQDFMSSALWRQRYWARSLVGFPEFMAARPNLAHTTLAAWEGSGKMIGVITQNVDRLHQRAGQQQIIDLHGRLDQVVCMACGELTPRALLQDWLVAHNPLVDRTAVNLAPDGDADLPEQDYGQVRIPDCQSCGGILKPNVVFYGDSVAKAVVDKAYRWVDACDAVLVLGSSLMVFSSFRFVRKAATLGLPIYAINEGKTRADDLLALKLVGDCGAVMSRLRF